MVRSPVVVTRTEGLGWKPREDRPSVYSSASRNGGSARLDTATLGQPNRWRSGPRRDGGSSGPSGGSGARRGGLASLWRARSLQLADVCDEVGDSFGGESPAPRRHARGPPYRLSPFVDDLEQGSVASPAEKRRVREPRWRGGERRSEESVPVACLAVAGLAKECEVPRTRCRVWSNFRLATHPLPGTEARGLGCTGRRARPD